MKTFYTAGSVAGLTFAVYGRDHSTVDVDIFKAGANKPFFHRDFFSKLGALTWINKELAKLS